MPQAHIYAQSSTSVPVIDKIGNLLKEVEELAVHIPTTSDHLGRISGIFPKGQGPNTSDVEEHTRREAKILESMKTALSFMQTGFAEFGLNQDLLCKKYETEADTSGTQIKDKESTDDFMRQSAEPVFFPDFGLGQSARDAVEEARQAEEAASPDTVYAEEIIVEENVKVASLPQTPPHDYSEEEMDDDLGVNRDIDEGGGAEGLKCGDAAGATGVLDDTVICEATATMSDQAIIGEVAQVANPFPQEDATAGVVGSCQKEDSTTADPNQPAVEDVDEAVLADSCRVDLQADKSELHDHDVAAGAEGVDAAHTGDALEAVIHHEAVSGTVAGSLTLQPESEEAVSGTIAGSPTSQPKSEEQLDPSSMSTPPLSAIPAMSKIKEVYYAVLKLRKDPGKRGKIMFENDECQCTIDQVGEAFKPNGFLCSFTVCVGTFLLGEFYKGSDKLVVPYVCCRQIFEGNLTSRRVRRLFSLDAEDRLDTKEVILFATFDPPSQNVPGHFCIVAVNFRTEKFELLDSLRGPDDVDGKIVLHKMARRIKRLWNEAPSSNGRPFSPSTLDHFKYHYVKEQLRVFHVADLAVSYTPEVQIIPEEAFVNLVSTTQKVLKKLNPPAKLSKAKQDALANEKANPTVVTLDNDDDDFVSGLSRELTANTRKNDVQACSVSSSGDFVTPKDRQLPSKTVAASVEASRASSGSDFDTQKGRYPPKENLILSNKRPSKFPQKLMDEPVPTFKPYVFPHLPKAKQLKEQIRSKEYLSEHREVSLVQFGSPVGVQSSIDGNMMYKVFGRAEMMESEVMDYIMSYWKESPEMKYIFESGDHVLLSPYTIPYLLDFVPFERKDSKGNIMPPRAFNAAQAAKELKQHMSDNENLLKANLIILPHFMNAHHSIYVLNKYRSTLDIYDSKRYVGLKHTSKSKQHEDRVEIISRLVAVMKEPAYNKHIPQ